MSLLSAERIATLPPIARLRSVGKSTLSRVAQAPTQDAREPLLSDAASSSLDDLQERMDTESIKNTSQGEVWYAINKWSAERDAVSFELAAYTISHFRGSSANKILLLALQISRDRKMSFTEAHDIAAKADQFALDEAWFAHNPIMNHAATAE
jgi:hypothetical protein